MTKKKDNRPSTADEVLDQHEFAKGLYGEAVLESQKVEDLITNAFEPPQDVADAGNVQVTQTVRARAILERIRQMMQINTIEFSVMPRREGDKEAKATTRLEKILRGIDRKLKYQTKRDHDRDAAFWFVLRGQAMYETRFRPDYKGTDMFPIQILTPDPNTIFPVYGSDKILFYTKEYDVYSRELRKQLDADGYDCSFLEDDKENNLVAMVEYWDDTYHALVCSCDGAGHLIYSKAHEYGFVPLSIGRCMDTPLASPRWAYQSVIAPIVDHIKQLYILASKMATGVNLFYYPLIFYKSATGQPVVFNPAANTGADAEPMPTDGKWEVLNPTPNSAILQQLMSFYLSDIYLMTVPEIAFGSEPQNLQSGFAVSQVLSAVSGAIKDKLPQMEMAAADCRGNVLRLLEQFTDADGFDFDIPVDLEEI